MSSTKIVIIVLVLIGVLFVILVVRGAFRDDPTPSEDDPVADAKKQKPPDWTKKIEGLFSSLKPKRPLEKKTYSLSGQQTAQEKIQPDLKQPFRTVRFHLLSGRVEVGYTDDTRPVEKKTEKLQSQTCSLPDLENENPKADTSRCSIVALKQGGTVTIACHQLSSSCQVEVE